MLVSKRDDLSQKYEDALALSEGIALRRHQVADYLVKCLSGGELKSFEHFVEAKLRLFLEKQAVEDIITIIQSKLQLLNSDGAFD